MKNFNNHGVTLVETVIALAVLAFGILSLMMLYTSGMRGNVKAQSVTKQSNRAATQIEEIMATRYNKLKDLNNDNSLITDSNSNNKLGDEIGNCGASNTPPPEVDYCTRNDSMQTFWSVVEHSPIRHTKKIQVIVRPDNNIANEIVYEYVKPYHP